jgi:hypothetical protein
VALAQPPPPGAPRLPTRLQDPAGEWMAGAVATAAHALVAQRPELAGVPNDVAGELFRMYGPGQDAPLDAQACTAVPSSGLTPEGIYDLYVEAPRLVRRLSDELGPELFAVLSLRLKGLGLRDIARRLGHPHAAWAHRKLELALEQFHRFLRRHGLSHRMGLAMGRKAASGFTS